MLDDGEAWGEEEEAEAAAAEEEEEEAEEAAVGRPAFQVARWPRVRTGR